MRAEILGWKSQTKQTKQTGGGAEQKSVLWAKPTEPPPCVELPNLQPVRTQARNDVAEHDRDR